MKPPFPILVDLNDRPCTVIGDRFRARQGAYEMAWQGLRNARAAGLWAGVRFTVTQDNVDDIPAVLANSVEEGIERFCMYHLVYAGRGTELAPRDLTPACSPHCKTGRRPVGAMEANTP